MGRLRLTRCTRSRALFVSRLRARARAAPSRAGRSVCLAVCPRDAYDVVLLLQGVEQVAYGRARQRRDAAQARGEIVVAYAGLVMDLLDGHEACCTYGAV